MTPEQFKLELLAQYTTLKQSMATIGVESVMATRALDAILKLLDETLDDEEPTPVGFARRVAPLRGKHKLGWAAQPGTLQAYQNVSNLVGVDGEARRIFLHGDTDFNVDINAGRLPYVEVRIGSNYEAMAEQVASYTPSPVLLTVGHEEERRDKKRNPQWFLENYYKAYDILKWAPNALIGTTWMNYSIQGQNDYVDDLLDWLPEPSQTHFLGVDLYIKDTTKSKNAPKKQLELPLHYAKQLGVPLAVGEFAVAGTVLQRSQYAREWITYVQALHDRTEQPFVDAHLYAPLTTCWFHSDRGSAPPTVFDGRKTWEMNMASDGVDLVTPKVWREGIRSHAT